MPRDHIHRMSLPSYVKVNLTKAVALIRDFEIRLAAHNNQPYFDWGARAHSKRGTLRLPEGEAWYWFHGRGCTLRWNEVVLDYDYGYPATRYRKHPICFGPWKFARTLRSLEEGCAVEQVSRESEQAAHVWLQELEREGLVRKLPDGLAFYEVDEVALEEKGSAA